MTIILRQVSFITKFGIAKWNASKELAGMLIWLLTVASMSGAPVSPGQAQAMVSAWLRADPNPLNTALSSMIQRVVSHTDAREQPLYYIVTLAPSGFVIVAADDWIEPILAFAPKGCYTPSESSPLGALVERDLQGRMAHVRGLQGGQAMGGAPSDTVCKTACEKWRQWSNANSFRSRLAGVESTPSISDIWVAPLVPSEWDQAEDGGGYCYNYWTPNHYVCGCGATAMAQLMRYHQWPTAGVGTPAFDITVDGQSQMRALRGGDGLGGAYNWSLMPLDPGTPAPEDQRQAIGALCHDAGVAVNMNYTSAASGMDFASVSPALRGAFFYSSAVLGYNNGDNLTGPTLYAMLNPGLDAGYPALLAIFGEGGHAVVCDGYGYNAGSLYHHINVGWGAGGESANVWYALPIIDPFGVMFSSIFLCAYNIYPTGGGEIISGRVADSAGNPLADAVVTATWNGGSAWPAVSNHRGIYALRLPASSTYSLSVARRGFVFPRRTVSTGQSSDYASNSGSRWNNNFIGTIDIDAPPVYQPVCGDADGDGRADPLLYAADSGIWQALLSANNYAPYSFQFGAGAASATSDYDGDGKLDPGVYEGASGKWQVLLSAGAYALVQFQLRPPTASSPQPASSDYDGDGRADPAVYDDQSGLWIIARSGAGYQSASFYFGGNGYAVVSADYDGDGKADPAIYQAESGAWAALFSAAGYTPVTAVFGGGGKPANGGYAPAVADYDGDGCADPAVYQETTGNWTLLLSGRGAPSDKTRVTWGAITYSPQSFNLGGPGYRPATADYDGDGKADPAVYQDAAGSWIILLSASGYQPFYIAA